MMSVVTGSLIPAQLTGKDFLKSSNTLVVKTSDGIPPDQIYLTTFHRDFRTSAQLPKNGTLPRPTPALIEHRDHRILERGTEALCSFSRPQLQTIHRIPAWVKLGTNMKMHADQHQVTFHSTQAEGYKSPTTRSTTRHIRPTVTFQLSSHHENLPQSTHRETFTGHTTLPVVKAAVRHLGGETTIKGDQDRMCFATHHKEAFQGKWCPAPAMVEKQFHSSLPMGDPEKLVERETTQTASFRHPGAHWPVGVMERLKVNLGDSENKWVSTTGDAYRRVKAERTQHRKLNRTLSSIPRGDVDPGRNRTRMTVTTNRLLFSEENHREFPSHVDGASLRTRSNVHFGRPELGKMFYRTSSKDDYPRREVVLVSPFTHPSGRVLSGLEPEPAITTAQRDYNLSNGKRQELPPAQLKQIKESHIHPPCEKHHFSTTHNEAFTPLPLSKTSPVDPHSLQRSHVPL